MTHQRPRRVVMTRSKTERRVNHALVCWIVVTRSRSLIECVAFRPFNDRDAARLHAVHMRDAGYPTAVRRVEFTVPASALKDVRAGKKARP